MPIPPNTRFGPYEILSPLGSGGMGEVYRARDTRLGRDVAIKTLPDAFVTDPERVARFTREAQVLASLNHPNIAHVYGVEEGTAGSRVLVMELVEGETLADRLANGKLPLEDALVVAKQIGAALEAAHDRGIIHRDLKPANIKIRPDGAVKVLDFGLAKLADSNDDSRPSLLSQSPTITSPAMMTGVGVLLGTAAYMSPEQARGKPLDKRTDIWSFGVVLYEMVTGRRAFGGEDVADTVSRVLQTQPPLDDVPASVRRLISKCLQKNPKDRLRDIGDSWELVDDPAGVSRPPTNRGTRIWQAVAALLALTSGAVLWSPWRHAPPPAPVVRFQISPPPGTTFANDVDDPPAISPDGTRVAFLAMGVDGRVRIWIRALDSLDARRLDGTEGAKWVLWSPNGKWVAFSLNGGELVKVPAGGGPGQTICVCASILRSAWGPTGVIVFGGATGLFKVPEDGGTPTALTTVDPSRKEIVHLLPSFLPDGRHLVYVRSGGATSGLYAASVDAKPSEQPVIRILDRFGQYGSGRLLFVRSGILFSQPFDVDQLRVTGESKEITRGLAQAQPPTSGHDVLAFGVNASPRQLTWFGRDGKPLGTIGQPGPVWSPRISRDDTRVVFARYDTGPGDIWLHDSKRGPYQFTSGLPRDSPLWISDSHVAYTVLGDGGIHFVRRAINGVGSEEQVSERVADSAVLTDVSNDGKYAVFALADPKTRGDIWVLPLDGDPKPFPYVNGEDNELNARLSPNGKWLAYSSDKRRRFEVYVDSFMGTMPNGPRVSVPVADGTRPVWSRDGKRLFFISADRKMMSVAVSNPDGPVLEFARPSAMFDVALSGDPFDTFDVTSDDRFLMAIPSGQRAGEPITVIVNWPAAVN